MPNRRSKKKLEERQYNFQRDPLKFIERNPDYKVRRWISAPEFSQMLRSQVVRAAGECALCGCKLIDALEVHHVDGNHFNNKWDNIAVVCANCHTLITKGKLNYWEELNQRNLKISCESRNTSENKHVSINNR